MSVARGRMRLRMRLGTDFRVSNVLVSMVSIGCSQGGGRTSDDGMMTLALGVAPTDVACLRLTITNRTRTVVKDLSVVPAQPVMATLSGRPLGSVTVMGDAFRSCPPPGH
jgi:hypothetical protein